MSKSFRNGVLAGFIVLAAAGSAIAQDDVAEFYAGKTVRIVVGIAVGSVYDINARLLARYLAARTRRP